MKKRKLLIMIGLATSLFTLEVLPMGLPLVNSTVYAAEQTAPNTQNLSVQKVMYEGVKPSITNDGEEKQLPDGAEKFNPEKYGDVEFTLVDITSYFNNKGEKGIQEELNGLTAEEYSNWINTHKEANTTPVTHSVNNDGKVNYDNVLATNQDGTGHVYAILETKSAKGLIEQIAQPIVVSLPMTNVVGNGWLNTINLYPKNKVKSLSFKLTKYGEEISDTNKLAGATFDLYSGVPGNGTKLNKDVLTTNKDGVITVDNLTKGNYYFVETSAPKNYVIGSNALNDNNNKLKFSIGSNGVDKNSLHIEFINYLKPESNKEVTNGTAPRTNESSFTIGDTVDYENTIRVPKDIAGGKIINGDSTETTSAYSVFNYKDIAGTGLSYLGQAKDVNVTAQDGTKLELNTDYTYEGLQNGFKINFIMNNGKVSNKVASLAGQNLKVSYPMILNEDALIDGPVENSFDLSWNNNPAPDSTVNH